MEVPASFFRVSFDKALAFGYKTDDVDTFVTNALRIIRELQAENTALQEQVKTLSESVAKYKEDEDCLRSAVLQVQKLGDSMLRDSKNRAETIIREATAKADDIVRDAHAQLVQDTAELERVQRLSAEFKERLFKAYREHLAMITNIPTEQLFTGKEGQSPADKSAAAPEPSSEKAAEKEAPAPAERTEPSAAPKQAEPPAPPTPPRPAEPAPEVTEQMESVSPAPAPAPSTVSRAAWETMSRADSRETRESVPPKQDPWDTDFFAPVSMPARTAHRKNFIGGMSEGIFDDSPEDSGDAAARSRRSGGKFGSRLSRGDYRSRE